MSTKNRVSKTLEELKNDGYLQVSASEVKYKTGLARRAVIAALHRSDYLVIVRHGEVFVSLIEAPQIKAMIEK